MKTALLKKEFYLLISIVFVAIALVACGNKASNSDKQSSDDNEPTYNLKLNSVYAPAQYDDEPKHIATVRFAELVKERTDGRVNIEVYHSDQLVPVDQAFDALVNGTIDIEAASSYWGETIPTQDFPWLPFAFYGPDHMRHVLRETEIGEIYERNLEEKGVKVLFYWPSGNQGIISKDPITKLEDMNGKTIRLGSGLWTSWYKEMGVAPANISGPEQYEALMRGTIDGAIYPFYTLETSKLHEVAKNITVPGILDPILCVNYISLKTWESLPEDIQKIIEEVALEVELEIMEIAKKIDDNVIEFAKNNGVTVNRLSEKEFQKFVDSSEIVWEEFAVKNEDTRKIVEILKENQKEYLKNNPDAQDWAKKWIE